MSTKKKVVKKTPTRRTTKNPFRFEVTVNDVEFKTTAKNLREALEKFINSPVYPFGAKTQAVFKYGIGKNVRVKRLFPAHARRLLLMLKHKPSAADVFAETMAREVRE